MSTVRILRASPVDDCPFLSIQPERGGLVLSADALMDEGVRLKPRLQERKQTGLA